MKTNRVKILIFGALSLAVCLCTLRADEPAGEISLATYAIPKSLGKIEGRFTGTKPRWILHIQDVHAHLTAQENIAAIIDHLNSVYRIKTVALEGGWSSTTLPKSWGLPSSREKQTLARALLEDDYLTGAGYAALFSQTPIHLVGIEDQALYEENRQIYLKHLNEREVVQSKVEKLGQSLIEEKKAAFHPELLSFDRTLADFREGKNADKFIPDLMDQAAAKGVDVKDLDQMILFKKLYEKEAILDKTSLQQEARRLMEDYKRGRLTLEELLKSGQVPGDKLQFYPQCAQYLEILKLQDQVSHIRLFEQLEQVITRFKEKLFASEGERALDARAERFYTAKKLLLLQATPKDLKIYEGQAAQFRSELEASLLGEALTLGLKFYEIAKKRDEVFFDKIMNNPNLAGDIALVTGGFHTEGLSAQLEEAGISYIVVTPDLNNEPADEKLYFQRLRGFTSQALGENGDIQTRQNFDLKFFDVASNLIRKIISDYRDAVSKVVGSESDGANLTPSYIKEGPAPANKAGGFDVERFLGLSPEKQLKTFKEELLAKIAAPPAAPGTRAQKGLVTQRLLIRASVADRLYRFRVGELELGKRYWEENVEQNQSLKVILLLDPNDLPGQFVGARSGHNAYEISNVKDVKTFLGMPRNKRLTLVGEAKKLAIIDSAFQNQGLLIFPEEAESLFLFPRVLADPNLLPSDPYLREKFFNTVRNLLIQIYSSEAAATSA